MICFSALNPLQRLSNHRPCLQLHVPFSLLILIVDDLSEGSEGSLSIIILQSYTISESDLCLAGIPLTFGLVVLVLYVSSLVVHAGLVVVVIVKVVLLCESALSDWPLLCH